MINRSKSYLFSFFRSLIKSIAVSRSGQTLYSCSSDKTICRWSCAKGTRIDKFPGSCLSYDRKRKNTALIRTLTDCVYSSPVKLEFSPDGQTLLIHDVTHTVEEWSVANALKPYACNKMFLKLTQIP